jgi:hypothetical protein
VWPASFGFRRPGTGTAGERQAFVLNYLSQNVAIGMPPSGMGFPQTGAKPPAITNLSWATND